MDRIKDRNIILGLILIQLAVCLPFLNSFPVDLDEPFSVFYAQQPVSKFLPFLLEGNNPPLYFLLLNGWIQLFGISAFALRLLSVLFGAITIIPLFKLSRKYLGKEFSTAVVILFIFSTFNHYHNLEIRMYSMMVCLVVSIIYLIQLWLFEAKRYMILLGVLNAALLYTHYLGLFIVGVEIILFIIFYKSQDLKGRVMALGASLTTFVLYIPLFYKSFSNVSSFAESGSWLARPELSELYGNIIRFFNYNISFFITAGLIVIAAILYRANLGTRLKEFVKTKKNQFMVLFFAFCYFGMFIFSFLVQPIFLDRYLLYISPFLYLLFFIIADTIILEKSKRMFSLLLVIPMVASCYYIPKTNRDGDALAEYIKQRKTENTIVAICPPFYDLTFVYHFDSEIFTQYDQYQENLTKNGIQKVYGFEDIKLNDQTTGIIYLNANSEFLYPNNNILPMLIESYQFVEEERFLGGYMVHNFKIKND